MCLKALYTTDPQSVNIVLFFLFFFFFFFFLFFFLLFKITAVFLLQVEERSKQNDSTAENTVNNNKIQVAYGNSNLGTGVKTRYKKSTKL